MLIRLRRVLVYCITFMLVCPPSLFAGGLTADPNAPSGQRPGIDTAPNGVPLVNIARPNENGLSHNQYHDFNVGKEGLIFNNSSSEGVSQLGGYLSNNPNFAPGERGADTILNEVTSSNRSHIQGYMEVFGKSADVILANPNGITVNGGGFINVPNATLTTGTPQVDNGMLRAFEVQGGDIVIAGQGINANNLDAFALYSRTAEITADIYAQNLDIVAGRNRIDAVTGEVQPLAGGADAPNVAIDSSLLGGMYAGRIRLSSTEKGVGVNLQGTMQSGSGLLLTADGKLVMRDAAAHTAMDVNAGSIEIQEYASAGQRVSLTAQEDIRITGSVLAGKDIVAEAGNSITLRSGELAAGVAGDGSVSLPSNAELRSRIFAANESRILAGNNVLVEADSVSLHNTTVAANKDLDLTGQKTVEVGNTSLYAGRNLTVEAGNLAVNASQWTAMAALTVDTAQASLKASELGAGTNARVTAETGIAIDSSLVYADQALQVSGGSSLTLANSQLSSVKAMDLAGQTLEVAGSVLIADANLSLTGTDIVFDAAKMQGTNLNLTASSSLRSAGSILLSLHDLLIQGGGSIALTQTEVQANRSVSLEADAINLGTSSTLLAGNDITVTGTALELGTDTYVEASRNLSLTGQDVLSSAEITLLAGNAFTLHALNSLILGRDSTLYAVGDMALAAGALHLADNAMVQAKGALSALVDSSLVLGDGSVFRADGIIRLVAGAMDVGRGGLLYALGNVQISSGDGFTLGEEGALYAGGNLSLTGTLISLGREAFVNALGNLEMRGSLAVGDLGTLQAGRSLSLTGTSMEFGADSFIYGAEGLTLTAAAQFALAADSILKTGGNLSLTAKAVDIAKASVLYAGGNFDLTGTDSVSVGEEGSMFADGNLTLTSASLDLGRETVANAAGDLTLSGGSISVGQEGTLYAGGDMSLNGTSMAFGPDAIALAKGDMELGANGNFIAALNAIFKTDGNLTVSAQAMELAQASMLYAGGDLKLTSNSSFTLGDEGTLYAGNNLSLTSTGPMTMLKDVMINALGTVLLKGGDITLGDTGTLYAGGDMSLTGTSMNFGAETFAQAKGDLAVNATDAFKAGVESIFKADGDLTVSAKAMELGKASVLYAGGNLGVIGSTSFSLGDEGTLYAGNNLTLTSALIAFGKEALANAVGNLILKGGSLSLDQEGTLYAGGDMSLSGTSMDFGVDTFAYAKGTMGMSASDAFKAVVNGIFKADGNLTVSAKAMELGKASVLYAGGNLNVTGSNSFSLADEGTLYAGKSLTLTSAAMTMLKDVVVNALGNLTLKGGSIDLGQEGTLYAGGDMNLTGTSMTFGVDTMGMAKGRMDITASDTFTLAANGIFKADGNLTVSAKAMELGKASVLYAGGNLGMSGTNGFSLGEAGTLYAGTNLTLSSNGAITLAKEAVVNALGALSLKGTRLIIGQEGTLYAGGDLTLTGTSMEFGADSIVFGKKNLTATATDGFTVAVNGIFKVDGAMTVAAKAMELGKASVLYAGGLLDITSTNRFTLGEAGTLYAGSNLTLSSNGVIDLGKEAVANAGGALNLTGSGLTVGETGTLYTNGNMTLKAENMDFRQDAIAYAKGNLTASGAEFLALAANSVFKADGAMTLSAKAMELGKASVLYAGGNLGVTSTNGFTLADKGTLYAGNNLTLNSNGAIALGREAVVNALGTLKLTGSSLELGQKGTLYAGADATVQVASQTYAADSMMYGVGSVALLGNVLNLAQNFMAAAVSGALRLESDTLSLSKGNVFSAGTDLSLKTQSDLTLGNDQSFWAGKSLSLSGGDITLGKDIAIESWGALTLAGKSISFGNYVNNLFALGNMLIQGTSIDLGSNTDLSAGGNLTLTGTSITMEESNILLSDGNMQLKASGDLHIGDDNTLYALGDINLQGTNVDVDYSLVFAGEDLQINATNLTNNQGALYADRDARFFIRNTLWNNGGELYATENMTIAGANATSQLKTLLNESGNIGTALGSISITAQDVINKKSVFEVERVFIEFTSEYYQWPYHIPDVWQRRDDRNWYEDQIVADSTSAKITSGGDIVMNVDTLRNEYSFIAAGNNATINARTIDNIGTELLRVAELTAWYHYHKHGDNHLYVGHRDTEKERIGLAAAAITAGNRLTVSVEEDLNNYSVSVAPITPDRLAPPDNTGRDASGQPTITDPNGSIDGPHIGDINTPNIGDITTTDVGNISGPNVRDINNPDVGSIDIPDGGNGSIDVPVVGGITNPDIQGPAEMTEPGEVVVATVDPSAPLENTKEVGEIPDTMLPSGPIFKSNDNDDHPYKVETNPILLDRGLYYGSEYFLSRLDLDFGDLQHRLLGDSYYETRLVQNQIMEATGQRYLSGYSTDGDQMEALLSNAASVYGDLDLSIGLALTADQVAALSCDIVWLVEQVVDGETVLVPKLYLASVSENELLGGGANMKGREVVITAGGDLNNSGRISGDTVVAVADNILNMGGTINGLNMDLEARLSLINEGGLIAGGNISLTAGEDIISRTTTRSYAFGSGSNTNIDSLAGIVASGDLAMRAGNDLILQGSSVSAGGDALLTAGRNISMESVTERASFNASIGRSSTSMNSVTHTVSDVNVGGNLVMQSGNDTLLAGTRISAGDSIHMEAGGNMVVTAVRDTYNAAARTSGGGFGSSGNSATNIHTETVKGGTIEAGNNLTMLAGLGENRSLTDGNNGSLTMVGSSALAGEDVTMAASGDVILTDMQQNSSYSHSSSSRGLLSSRSSSYNENSSVSMGSSVVGENVLISAGENVMLKGSGVAAQQDATLIANKGDVLLMAGENSHSVSQSSSRSGFGIGGGSGGFTSLYGSKSEQTTSAGTSSVGSVVTAGNDLTIVANRDIVLEGARLGANNDLGLSAGRDVNILTSVDTQSSSHDKTASGFGLGSVFTHNVELFAGYQSTASGNSHSSTSNQGSQLVAGNNLNIEAGSDINVLGSQFRAGNDINMNAGNDLNLLQATDEQTSHEYTSRLRIGLTATATQNITPALRDGRNAALEGITGVKRDDPEEKLSTWDRLTTVTDIGSSVGKLFSPKIEVGIGAGASLTGKSESSQSTTAVASELQAGNDINLVAGNDLTLQGTRMNADNDILLGAGNDLLIGAGISTGSKSQAETSSSVGLSYGGKLTDNNPMGWTASLGASGKGGSNTSSTYSNAEISAGGTLSTYSGRDTIIEGANLQGDLVDMYAGRDLNVASLQDHKEGGSWSWNASLSGNFDKYDEKATVSGGGSRGETSSDRVGRQTTIIGANGVNIYTEGNTHIGGAVIASLNDNLTLDTGTLSFEDLKGNESESKWGFNLSYSVSRETEAGTERTTNKENEQAVADLVRNILGLDDLEAVDKLARSILGEEVKEYTTPQLLQFVLNRKDNWEQLKKYMVVTPGTFEYVDKLTQQTAQATIGEGTITVRDNPDMDLSGLNRTLGEDNTAMKEEVLRDNEWTLDPGKVDKYLGYGKTVESVYEFLWHTKEEGAGYVERQISDALDKADKGLSSALESSLGKPLDSLSNYFSPDEGN